MSDVAIRVENLFKKYVISHRGQERGYPTFRDQIAAGIRGWTSRLSGRGGPAGSTEEFIALNDLSFEVARGEVIGLIGRNGAGKSTLLKILSRITEPSAGRVTINGRVASLLEVGTGFHPELTGRQNIFLNGSILGMTRAEVRRRFDEIVAFAEVEQFLDTPVKRYSSGMYARLAFSVAAHLESEILIVDEVLAVGDREFQDRCIGRMQGVAASGRTVIFVSHQLGSLERLCDRGFVLERGEVIFSGGITESIGAFLRLLDGRSRRSLADRTDRRGQGPARVVSASVLRHGSGGKPVAGQDACVRFEVAGATKNLMCVYTVLTENAQPVFNLRSDEIVASQAESVVIECHLPALILLPGNYRINVALMDKDLLLDHVESAVSFEVAEGVVDGRVVRENRYGVVHPSHRWEIDPL